MSDEQQSAFDAACAETAKRSREILAKGRELAEAFESGVAAKGEIRDRFGLDEGKLSRFFETLPADGRARAEAEWEAVRNETRQAKEDALRAAGADIPKSGAGKKRQRNMA